MGVVLGAPRPPDGARVVLDNQDKERKRGDAEIKKESLEARFNNKIFEREYSKGISVLPFNDFSTVMSEAYYLNEDDTPELLLLLLHNQLQLIQH